MYPDIIIYLLGDFNQCAPINTNDPKAHEYSNSHLLKWLTDGQHLMLDRNQRSDPQMWNIQQQLLAGANVRGLFQKYDPKLRIYKHICYRNDTRRDINRECQQNWLQDHPDVFNIRMRMAMNEESKLEEKGIEYVLTAGMPVIATVTRSGLGIVNNEEFLIDKITDSTIFLKNEYHEELVEIPLEKFGYAFDLAFATTIHKAQGSTYKQPHVVHEWSQLGNDSLNVCRLRYTAITRTTAWDLLMVA
jgi:hypothetical protein